MNPHPRLTFRRRTRGSGLMAVLIFTTMLLMLVGNILTWSVNERRASVHNAGWLEARNAAEAVSEYGCFQVAQAFNTKMNPSFGSSGTTTISFTSTIAATYFSGSHTDTSSIEVKAGTVTQVPTGKLYFVDPNDPNNRFDPLTNRYVFRRD